MAVAFPVKPHPKLPSKSTLEIVMTTLHAGGKFGGDGYKQGSSGLHGVGVSAVNALSEYTRVEVRRDNKLYVQEYRCGVPVAAVQPVGPAVGTGTTTIFKPDLSIMETGDFQFDTLAQRIREMAYLNRGLTLSLVDEREGREQQVTFYFDGGLKSFVRHLNKTSQRRDGAASAYREAGREDLCRGGDPVQRRLQRDALLLR